MQVCGQTLILVDSDDSVSILNQKIVRATLKYMFDNSYKPRAYCLTTYGHTIDENEIYITDSQILTELAEQIEFVHKDSNLTDVLCSVLTKWREADFACRDIVVFTDGIEQECVNYAREELFYLIESTDYPIYIVDLVQEGNEYVRKDLSAIATTSGGKLFYSEFEGDDAGIDRQIADGIFSKMDQYEKDNWSMYGEVHDEDNKDEDNLVEDSQVVESQIIEDEVILQDDYTDNQMMEENEGIIYESSGVESETVDLWILAGSIILCIALIITGLLTGLVLMKNRRKHAAKDNAATSRMIKQNREDVFFKCQEETEGEVTRIIGEESGENTRLLSDDSLGVEFVNVDEKGNNINMRIVESCILGRKAECCDYVIADDAVSKRHCEIIKSDYGLFIKDLESANGVYINGKKISKCTIANGDIVTIGRTKYTVKCYE